MQSTSQVNAAPSTDTGYGHDQRSLPPPSPLLSQKLSSYTEGTNMNDNLRALIKAASAGSAARAKAAAEACDDDDDKKKDKHDKEKGEKDKEEKKASLHQSLQLADHLDKVASALFKEANDPALPTMVANPAGSIPSDFGQGTQQQPIGMMAKLKNMLHLPTKTPDQPATPGGHKIAEDPAMMAQMMAAQEGEAGIPPVETPSMGRKTMDIVMRRALPAAGAVVGGALGSKLAPHLHMPHGNALAIGGGLGGAALGAGAGELATRGIGAASDKITEYMAARKAKQEAMALEEAAALQAAAQQDPAAMMVPKMAFDAHDPDYPQALALATKMDEEAAARDQGMSTGDKVRRGLGMASHAILPGAGAAAGGLAGLHGGSALARHLGDRLSLGQHAGMVGAGGVLGTVLGAGAGALANKGIGMGIDKLKAHLAQRKLEAVAPEVAADPAAIIAAQHEGSKLANMIAAGQEMKKLPPGQPASGASPVTGPKHLVESNQKAIDMTRGEAYSQQRKDLQGVFQEPALRKANDSTLQDAFHHNQGSKLASAKELLARLQKEASA